MALSRIPRSERESRADRAAQLAAHSHSITSVGSGITIAAAKANVTLVSAGTGISTGMTYLVRNVEFSKVIWGNYFGKHVVENMRRGLSANLPKD